MQADPVWAEALSLANAALALLVLCLAIYDWKCAPGVVRWLKVFYAVVGAYWFAIYVFVFLTPSGSYDSVFFGQVFIRPAFTVTLAVMASALLYRARSGRKCKDDKGAGDDDVQ
jgi:hypothetical protein